jgi:putative ABC transport system permease protein
MLAEKLGVGAGDGVDVEVLEGARRRETVRVTGVVEDFIGVSAYMQLDALHRLARGPEVVTGAFMAVEASARAELSAELKELPVVASVASPADMLRSFEEQLAESLFVSVFFMLAFSGVIAVAVVYNGARIALSERGRELASLRVLGFSQNEVAVLLLGEQGLITLAAIPLGWVIGYLLAAAVVAGVATESYRIPLVVSAQTYMYSAGATLVAAIVSGWIVRRRLDRMDLVEVLKTRE